MDLLEGHFSSSTYFSFGIDFISSHARAAYVLNCALEIQLSRANQDFSPTRESVRSGLSSYFPRYVFSDRNNEEEWAFVVNKGKLKAPVEKASLKFLFEATPFLLPEMKLLGGFLIIKGSVNSENIMEKLAREENFRWACPVKVEKFKNYLETFFLYGT